MILFALPENEAMTEVLAQKCGAALGKATVKQFPDGESYVRLHSDVQGHTVVLVQTLKEPDEKFLPLYFLTRTLQEAGAERVILLAPYLSYMRQDAVFHEGEGVTSAYFAELLSGIVDGLITVDPHLHRWSSLSDIYSIPYRIVHGARPMAEWIRNELEHPLLIGPDIESEQWVKEVADRAGAPYLIWKKERYGDRDVQVNASGPGSYRGYTPVLIDDIVSTASTMIETVSHLKEKDMERPVCMGVHAVFAEGGYEELLKTGARVLTCNSIPHPSNEIDLSQGLSEALLEMTKR